MEHETAFRRWRREMGFTQDEAAAALGVSKSLIANFDIGRHRSRGTPAVPSYAERVVMAALICGMVPKPWPES